MIRRAVVAVENEDPVLFFDDVVEITGIPAGTLRDLRLRGQGPPFSKSGRRLRIRYSRLKPWMDAYDQPDQ